MAVCAVLTVLCIVELFSFVFRTFYRFFKQMFDILQYCGACKISDVKIIDDFCSSCTCIQIILYSAAVICSLLLSS